MEAKELEDYIYDIHQKIKESNRDNNLISHLKKQIELEDYVSVIVARIDNSRIENISMLTCKDCIESYGECVKKNTVKPKDCKEYIPLPF